MARIRTVKPAFFRHRGLFLLEQSSGFPIRVAFEGLWTVADREGRFRWQPEELKLDCLPYDDVDFSDVLNALERGGFVCRYEDGAKAYGWIPSFAEHQVINQREAASTLPEPPAGACMCVHVQDYGEGKGREEEGKGKGTEECAETLTRSTPADGPRGALERRADDRATPPLPEALLSAGEPILLLFPTQGTGGTEWRLRRAQVDEWQTHYPHLDVIGECGRALMWVKAHPGREKTVRGMPAFLNAWLARAVDSGRGMMRPVADLATEPAVDWYAECQTMHGGTCGGQMRHHTRKLMDAERAKAAS